jgi:flavin-dependent dehydrogenase
VADHRNRLKADVAIVGAGPAGTATAISCARAGLRVVILERERFPRERPGETLHPGIAPLLGKLGVLERVSRAGFLRHEGIWVCWDLPLRFVPYGADGSEPWRGFQAWRAELDVILLERARELGAEIIQPCRVLYITASRDRINGLKTSSGVVEARFVVDAAGSRHWLARRFGLTIRYLSPRLIARFGYLKGTCRSRDSAPAIFADESGWTWTAKVRADLYHWTRLNLDGKWPESTFVPNELRGLSPHGRSSGADVGWRVVEKPAGPGYFVVGDAAAVLDPASSHGVLKALLSGMLAAHLIVETLIAGRSERAVAGVHSDWVAHRVAHDVAGLRSLYARLPRPPHWLRGSEHIPSSGSPYF